MPKKIYLPEDAKRSGIDVTWTRSTGQIDISGWYDSMVGIEGEAMHLSEFFRRLGITERDVRKAFAEDKNGR